MIYPGKNLAAADETELANLMSQIAEAMRARFGPGTFAGDYLRVVGERTKPEEHRAALERLTAKLRKFPVDPEAHSVLARLAARRRVPEWKILNEFDPSHGVLWALKRADAQQPVREGKTWIKDQSGRRHRIVPTEHYDLGTEKSFIAYLEKEVRNWVEQILLLFPNGPVLEIGSARHETSGIAEYDRDLKMVDWDDITRRLRRADETELILMAAEGPGPEELLLAKESWPDEGTRETLRKSALAKLSASEREVYELYLQGSELVEIARILGKKPGTIRALKFRAEQKISGRM
jgi:DNA-binding CsgD family transcriptional regulator